VCGGVNPKNKKEDENVLLVDAGIFQGTPYFNIMEAN
jgi:hypothetical protein